MQKEYLELGKQLKNQLQDTIADCEGIDQIQVEVINEIGDSLIYGLSIVELHGAYYLFGSTFGGGFEFIELIEEDEPEEVLSDYVFNNFGDMKLSILEQIKPILNINIGDCDMRYESGKLTIPKNNEIDKINKAHEDWFGIKDK
jgi:hypothetical protein